MLVETRNKIFDLAKNKKDGVYSYQGIPYRVYGYTVTHVAEENKIFQCFGGFDVEIGTYISSAHKTLRAL